MTIHDFTYTGGDSGAPYQVQQYDRLDRAVAQVQYYVESVRDWRQDVVNYATQARQDRDHIQTLGDTIVNTGQHIDTMVQVSVDAAETATTAASHTATDRQAAQTARTGAETAETSAETHATDAASSASSAADILTATEALGITVDNSVGTAVYLGGDLISYKSGWRNISDHVTVPTEGDLNVLIKRENTTVFLSFDMFNPAEGVSSGTTILDIPQGFVPSTPARLGAGATYEMESKVYTAGSELVVTSGLTKGQRARAYIMWSADESLPTSLPGTPA